jgi:hypothetical protein
VSILTHSLAQLFCGEEIGQKSDRNCIQFFHISLRLFFSLSLPGPSQEKRCGAQRKKAERRRKEAKIKIILCLCIYMDRIIKIMYTCGARSLVCSLTLSPLRLVFCSTYQWLRFSRSPSPSSLISYHSFTQHINGNCLHFGAFFFFLSKESSTSSSYISKNGFR